MKTDLQPTRLADYRAPDFQIDRLDLDFVLDPVASRVTAKLAMQRSGDAAAPLILDGDGIKLVSIELDGTPLTPEQYSATPDRLEIAGVPDTAFTLEI